MIPFLVNGNIMVPMHQKMMRSRNERMDITALATARLWFQSRQSYRPTDKLEVGKWAIGFSECYRRFRWTHPNTAGRNWKPLRSNRRCLPLPTDRPWGGGHIGCRQRQTRSYRRLFVSSCWASGLGQIKTPLVRSCDYRGKSGDILSMMNCITKEFKAD